MKLHPAVFRTLVELSRAYKCVVPGARGRWRFIHFIRKRQPRGYVPGVVRRGRTLWDLPSLENDAASSVFYDLAYDPETVHAIDAVLREGDYAVDIGANIGIFATYMARRVGPAGKVFAFEPSPIHFPSLARNAILQSLHNLHVFNLAVADAEGERLHYTTASSGSLISDFQEDGHECIAVNRVKSMPLDRVISEANAARVRLVKVDVDGNEREVLRGARTFLAHGHPFLLLEVADGIQRLSGSSARALLEDVAELGYGFCVGRGITFEVARAESWVQEVPVFRDVLCVHRSRVGESPCAE